ncbi:MAG: phosphoglycerate kinase [Pseudomonadota bacterium]
MGLDMYAEITPDPVSAPVDFKVENKAEIHYWRKHPDLHGWMEQLYCAKGGTAEMFNYVNVVLTSEDLDRLEDAILGSELPETSGFFFGQSDGSEVSDDRAFIKKAREAITAGCTVYYTSWW